MTTLLPSPSAVSYLPEAVLALLIAGYFGLRVVRGNRLQTNLHALGAMVCLGAFALASFLEHSFLQEASLVCLYWETPLVSLAAVFLIQFSYQFPTLWDVRRKEARIALYISSAAALVEIGYAWYRLQLLLGDGTVLWREPWFDWLQVLGFVWCATVMIRQERRFREEARAEARSGFARAFWPSNRRARSARTIATIFALAASVAWVTEFEPFGAISAWRSLILSEAMLIFLILFVVVYMNDRPEVTSVMVKLTGLCLAVILASLNVLVGIASHLHLSMFEARPTGLDRWAPPAITAPQTIRFLPRRDGGYEIRIHPLLWERVPGRMLSQSELDRGAISVGMEFTMRFFGREWSRVHVGAEGYLTFGRDPGARGFRSQYGGVPAVVPYLADLRPVPGATNAGVFIASSPERITITWNRMAIPGRTGECSMQVVLRRDGSLDISHASLPALVHPPEGEEYVDGWLVAVLPGRVPANPAQFRFAGGLREGGQIVGLSGVVQDQIYQWRWYSGQLCGPLSLLVVATAAISLAFFPLLFAFTLVRPLNDLVEAARRVNGGLLDEPARLHHQDEIGFLAQTFNSMMRRLRASQSESKATPFRKPSTPREPPSGSA